YRIDDVRPVAEPPAHGFLPVEGGAEHAVGEVFQRDPGVLVDERPSAQQLQPGEPTGLGVAGLVPELVGVAAPVLDPALTIVGWPPQRAALGLLGEVVGLHRGTPWTRFSTCSANQRSSSAA